MLNGHGYYKFDMANLSLKKAGILLPLMQRIRLCGTFRAEWTDRCKRCEMRHACKTIHPVGGGRAGVGVGGLLTWPK